MSRRPHVIQANHSSSTVRHALFFDTETDQIPVTKTKVVHRLNFGWWCYKRRRPDGQWTKGKWGRFDDRDSFWDAVVSHSQEKDKLVILCHNTGFDLSVLNPFVALRERGWKLTTACIDAPPTILRWRRNKCVIDALDTLNWWRVPLRDIGERVGLPKLDMPDGWDDKELADEYCRRDVEIIAKATCEWWDWIQAQDFGGAAPTIASQAMRCYRHRFMAHELFVDDTARANELARSAYHGGRVECFQIGEIRKSLHLLDVHSMYPHVMREHVYPTRLIRAVSRYSIDKLAADLTRYCVTADVTIRTESPAYPVRDGARLFFPVGEFRTRVNTPELARAVERGEIVAVHAVAVYECHKIFAGYVDEMFGRKVAAEKAGDLVGRHGFKHLLVNLYGKFGQRGIVWDLDEETEDLEAEQWAEVEAGTGIVTRYRKFGGIVQKQGKEQESRDSFPAIAGHVTSYARMYLWSLIEHARREHVYYSDTDSLLVDDIGLQRLEPFRHDERLGALGYEGATECATLWGCKDYDLGFKSRHKGVRKAAVWTGPDTVEQDQWSGLGKAMFNEKLDGPTTRRITKRLYRHYNKGVVGPGGIVTPHRLSLEDE